jgi:hypothetical protein
MIINSRLGRALLSLLLIAMTVASFLPGCSTSSFIKPITENNFDSTLFNSFLEPDFPFFSTYLDARNLGNRFPDNNVVARGLIVQLGDSAYVCFDRDLLRWSVAWSGNMLTESMLPQVSYKDFFNKKNTVPLLAGTPSIATGMYPGWSAAKPVTEDIRAESQRREGFCPSISGAGMVFTYMGVR